ncbi:MAG TPA: hypothetical protein VGZ93_11415 [Candidatus Methylacidiphilales bacterium]|nr:hypothetical protein [Candidatus Methylacidiphilales bacterium]
MNTITHDPLLHHTWKDIGGPMGLLLDCVFCSFVILAALGMMVCVLLILLADYAVSPVRAFMSKLHRRRSWLTAGLLSD